MIAVIPARYSSVRLPGKLLLPISGKPLIVHTAERAKAAKGVDRVIVATDDSRIADNVRSAGFEAVMTAVSHLSGSDRVAEVARSLPERSIIVNVQGDEPVISPATIESAIAAMLGDTAAKPPNITLSTADSPARIREPDIVTTSEEIEDIEDVFDPNVVKVAADQFGRALYFSRSPIPFPREAGLAAGNDLRRAITNDPSLLSLFRKHTGLYVYRREFLLRFNALEPTPLERVEMLEQLRALENRSIIQVVETRGKSIGVDTAEDFDRVKAMIEEGYEVGG